MNDLLMLGMAVSWLALLAGGWLGWQLLRQNGRMLLRLEELEKRLDTLEFEEPGALPGLPLSSESNNHSAAPLAEAETPNEERASRFGNRSLERSKLKRDGLKAGTRAPDFRLPCLDGTEMGLGDLSGKRVLLVFSSPHCGPCNTLAPHLENFYRDHADLQVVMISRGEPKENRAKVKEHGLTFPVLLQQHYEISRRYAMFATPSAYLIDETGIIAHDVAVGTDAIQELMARQRPIIPN